MFLRLAIGHQWTNETEIFCYKLSERYLPDCLLMSKLFWLECKFWQLIQIAKIRSKFSIDSISNCSIDLLFLYDFKKVQLIQFIPRYCVSSTEKEAHLPTYLAVWPDWAIYWTLGNFLKPLATINLHQSPPFLGNFYKGIKIIHISSETISGQLL